MAKSGPEGQLDTATTVARIGAHPDSGYHENRDAREKRASTAEAEGAEEGDAKEAAGADRVNGR